MLLSEIKFFQDKYDVTFQDAFIRFANAKNLGTGDGTHARVIWIDGKDWIWRAWFDDTGYEKFLSYVMQHPNNPHLPKILSRVRTEPVQFKLMPKGMKIKYVKIEKLKPMPFGKLMTAILEFDTACKYDCSLETLRSRTFEQHLEAIKDFKDPHDDIKMTDATFQQIEKHKAFFELMFEFAKMAANDLNEENVMMRGDTPVIIDPFGE